MTLPEPIDTSLRHPWAYRTLFFVAGLAMGAWAPLVPFARARAGVEDGQLGLLLLCLGVGSMLMMPFTGMLVTRFGCRRVMWAALGVLCVCLPLLAWVSSFALLVVVILLFGAGIGCADITMNIHGVTVERGLRKPLMSGFHGCFSLGGIFSAAGISGLLWCGASLIEATLVVVAAILGLMFTFAPNMLGHGAGEKGVSLMKPSRYVLVIGMLCFISFLAEGSVLDWSGVFLTTVRRIDPTQAGVGYAVFAVAMSVGRFNGDRIVRTLGAKKVLLLSGAVATLGYVLALAVDHWLGALAGFGLIGLGISNTVPVLFSLAGQQRAMPAGVAVTMTTIIGYLGILMGPAAIGFIAQASSLRVSFLVVAVLLLSIPLSASRLVRALRTA